MNVRPKLAPEQQLTIEEFLAFTETRPEEERWELIEGVAVLNPSPVEHHQVVVTNIATYLMAHKQRTGASWLPMLGRGHPRARFPTQPAAARCVREGGGGHRLARHRGRARAVRGALAQQHQGRPGLAAQGLCQRAELPALRDRLVEGRRGRRLRPRQRLEDGARSPAWPRRWPCRRSASPCRWPTSIAGRRLVGHGDMTGRH